MKLNYIYLHRCTHELETSATCPIYVNYPSYQLYVWGNFIKSLTYLQATYRNLHKTKNTNRTFEPWRRDQLTTLTFQFERILSSPVLSQHNCQSVRSGPGTLLNPTRFSSGKAIDRFGLYLQPCWVFKNINNIKVKSSIRALFCTNYHIIWFIIILESLEHVASMVTRKTERYSKSKSNVLHDSRWTNTDVMSRDICIRNFVKFSYIWIRNSHEKLLQENSDTVVVKSLDFSLLNLLRNVYVLRNDWQLS